MKRAIIMAAALLALGACGSDDSGGVGTTTDATIVTAGEPTTAGASTTTEAPEPTTAPPTTTVVRTIAMTAPTLSREAKVAIQRCLDDLLIPGTFIADLVGGFTESADQTIADCEEADTQTSVDQSGTALTKAIVTLNLELASAKLTSLTNPESLSGPDFAATVQPLLDTMAAAAGL